MFIQNMGFTQTVISTFAVIVLIIVTLSLNESVFELSTLILFQIFPLDCLEEILKVIFVNALY